MWVNSGKKTLFLFLAFLISAQNAASSDPGITETLSQQGFVPDHEEEILLVTLHNDLLYTVDKNGLLKIKKIDRSLFKQKANTAKTFLTISRETLKKVSMYYPYIFSITQNGTIEIFDLNNKLLLAYVQADEGIISLSKSRTIFAYLHQSKIHVLGLPDQTVLSNIAFSSFNPPAHIEIAKNNENMMIYYKNGTIEYRQCRGGRLLKSIKSNVSLESIVLSESRKYAVGFSQANLLSVDVLTGAIVSNLRFPNRIDSVISGSNKNTIFILSTNTAGIQTLNNYRIQSNGQLLQNDSLQIAGLKNISGISETDTGILLMGKTDGTLLAYNTKSNTFTLVYTNSTHAIFDAILQNEQLILAKSNGLVQVPLRDIVPVNTRQRTIQKEYNISVALQYSQPEFFVPRFRQSNQARKDSNADSSMTEAFYVVSQEEINPLMYSFGAMGTLQNTYPLQFIPTKLFAPSSNLILYYQDQNSSIVSRTERGENRYFFSAGKLFFSVENSASDAMIWLNAPLHATDSNAATTQAMELWGYPFDVVDAKPAREMGNEKSSLLLLENIKEGEHVELPFNESDIHYIEPVGREESNAHSFIVITKDAISPLVSTEKSQKFNFESRNNDYSVYFLTLLQKNEEKFSPLVSTHTKKLTSIHGDRVIKAVPYKTENKAVLIFTLNRIILIEIDSSRQKLLRETRSPYPDEFGQLLQLRTFQNHVLIIDKNNVLMLMRFEKNVLTRKAALLLQPRTLQLVYYDE